MNTETVSADTLADSARALLDQIASIRRTLEEMADQRPTVTLADLKGPRGEYDRAFMAQVLDFRKRYDMIDVSALNTEDPDMWNLEAGGSERYKVVEGQPFEAADDEENEGEMVFAFDNDADPIYYVVDTEDRDADHPTGYTVDSEHDDESDAEEVAKGLNMEDARDSLAGFPFAQTCGYEIESHEVDEFAAAGFLVYDYDRGSKTIAGIDGGGYNMIDAHWVPLFFRRMQRLGWLIETESGPRRPASAE